MLGRIGNMVDPKVPISHDEDKDNVAVALWPEPEEKPTLPCALGNLTYTFPTTKPLTHDDLLWRVDGYEPVRGQNVAGHRG